MRNFSCAQIGEELPSWLLDPSGHRPDNPQLSGMVFCAVQASSPALVWTNEAKPTIGLVQGDPARPNLDQLHGWREKHW
ncbi:hypothetical protein [Mycobacterium haemophilum]